MTATCTQASEFLVLVLHAQQAAEGCVTSKYSSLLGLESLTMTVISNLDHQCYDHHCIIMDTQKWPYLWGERIAALLVGLAQWSIV